MGDREGRREGVEGRGAAARSRGPLEIPNKFGQLLEIKDPEALAKLDASGGMLLWEHWGSRVGNGGGVIRSF